MEKRYQVFVSSTYEDLRDERQELMHALLELDCIPAGMELFPAANEAQWSVIRKVIGECDYYVVISAGRYGSLGPEGLSYTEMEYRYAVEIGKPVIAFLHKDPMELPAVRVEQTDEGREKLKAFRALLEQKLCKYWSTADELGSVVSRSLVRLMKTNPAIGWVRADEAVDTLAAGEILRLRKAIEELEGRLRDARHSPPPGSGNLAQGEEVYEIDFTFNASDLSNFSTVTRNFSTVTHNLKVELSWNDIFYYVGPVMINEATDDELRRTLNKMVEVASAESVRRSRKLKGYSDLRSFRIFDHDFQTIKIQLRALGLITHSQKPRSVKDTETYWTLTPYGDQVLTTLRAITRGAPASKPTASEADSLVPADADSSEPEAGPQGE